MHRHYATHVIVVTLSLTTACTPLDNSSAGDGGGVSIHEGVVQGEGGLNLDGGFGLDEGGQVVSVTPGTVETGLGTPCTGEGTLRCSAAGAGARQACSGGVWATMAACPSGQICQPKDPAPPICQTVAEVCKGSAGTAVCDGQGNLIVCNADGTVTSQQACSSARLCQLGLSTQRCATCVPSTEFKCTGTKLEVCAADGQSWGERETCATEALCNKVAGMCTSSLCAANKVACNGNTLTMCNTDGSAFKSQTPCPSGSTCDEMGGDCNTCEPGMKKCESGMVMTCNATGQAFTASACSGTQKCVGAGQCAACATNEDCSAMTQGCKVGVCSATNTCAAQNAATSTMCTASNAKPGTCSSGTCQCTPQCSGKQCGDDGCGGTCGQCTLGQKCASNRCVECTVNSDCPNSLDGCQTGMCSNGACSLVNAPSTKTCGSLLTGSGTCLSGTCNICRPNCGSDPTSCGSNSDGCGGTCRCATNKECRSGTCSPKLWANCTTPAGVSSECGATVGDSYSCFNFGTNQPFCATNANPCPSGTVKFGSGSAPCLVTCIPSPLSGCPSPFTKCVEFYPDTGVAYCLK